MTLTRRRFIATTSAAAALSSGSLLFPQRASAIEPVTMIAIASAAYSIYRMSKKGGGGIASLLSAQVEMLKAISNQVLVINNKLDLVYDKLKDVEAAIDRLPQHVTDVIFRRQVLGAIYRASQLVELSQAHEERRGRLYAIEQLEPEATRVLEALSQPISSIIVERNVANLPVVTMAWFMELQLRTRCLPYDRERIRKAAQSQLAEVARMIPILDERLDGIAAKAAIARRDLLSEESFNGYACYDGIVDRVQQYSGPGFGGYGYEQSGRLNRLARSEEPLDPAKDPYLTGFTDLAVAGIPLPADLALAVPDWKLTRENKQFVKRSQNSAPPYPDDVVRARRTLLERSCAGPMGTPSTFLDTHAKRAKAFEDLQLDALVNGNFLLVARELRRSAEGILGRMPPAGA